MRAHDKPSLPLDILANPEKAEINTQIRLGIPAIPLRDIVLFPGTVTPLLLGRPQSLSAMSRAMIDKSQLAFFCLQKNSQDEEINPDNVHPVGVVGRILSALPLPNHLHKILVEALFVSTAAEWKEEDHYFRVQLSPSPNEVPSAQVQQAFGIMQASFDEYVQQNSEVPRSLLELLGQIPSLEEKIYTLASHLKIPLALKQQIIERKSLEEKLALVQEFLKNEQDMGILQRRLEHEVRAQIAQSQKEFFLNEQLRKIQAELGSLSTPTHPEVRQLQENLTAKALPEKAKAKAFAELKRLDYLHPSSPEYSVVRNYLDWFLELPWTRNTHDNLKLSAVKNQLDKDHFGLKTVKVRILEHVAVYQLSKHHTTPILCLVGPPGVGKTSLGKSIAAALGREFVRISLGGVRDEAEIRGHRRTYIGAMPGRLIQALKKCQSMNPVILLDELDKMGGDFRGDPASALLEVLDPEQNKEFTDHFMEVGIDLSQVFFVTTANVEENIPAALHDRLEILRISGYYETEKAAIAKQHLVPKVLLTSGLTAEQFSLPDAVLHTLIRRYTREAGVRQLFRQLSKLARQRALLVVSQKKLPAVTPDSLIETLGIPVRQERLVPLSSEPGVVTGLAWTPAGGEILRIECSLLSGKGRLHLTGNLGEVMKESAQIALTLVRERARRFGVDPEVLQKTDIHLHVPEGAIKKDGPSAGIAMTLALLSAMTKQAVNPKFAFTGEVSLTGEIHAIGGLPEKAIAALQAGVLEIFVPAENKPDIRELPNEAKRGLKIHELKHIDLVIAKIFTSPNKKPALKK